jgi:hypothetical protein
MMLQQLRPGSIAGRSRRFPAPRGLAGAGRGLGARAQGRMHSPRGDARARVASPVATVEGGAPSAGQAPQPAASSASQAQQPYDWYSHWYPVAFEA